MQAFCESAPLSATTERLPSAAIAPVERGASFSAGCNELPARSATAVIQRAGAERRTRASGLTAAGDRAHRWCPPVWARELIASDDPVHAVRCCRVSGLRLSALSERSAETETCRDRDGRPSPTRATRYGERVPQRGCRVVLRTRGEAPRPRRLDRHGTPRPPGLARSDSSATRSTSAGTSTSTARPAPSRRSRPTSSGWRRRSWPCCRSCQADGARQLRGGRHRQLRLDAGERGSAQDAGAGQPSDRSRPGPASRTRSARSFGTGDSAGGARPGRLR